MRLLCCLLLLLTALFGGVTATPKEIPHLDKVFTEHPSPDMGYLAILKILASYPEIFWLADSDVAVTQENQGSGESWSERLFGVRYIECDRTLMALHCLDLILADDYLSFTAAQPKNRRLTPLQFASLNRIDTDAVRAALVLGDLGKSAYIRSLFPGLPEDHDDFYTALLPLLKEHDVSTTFLRLSPEDQDLLIRASQVGHLGHMTHLENGPEMFTSLRQSPDAEAFSFAFFVHLCDLAGALGHVNNHSSLVYTSDTHRALTVVHEACELILAGATEDEALAHCYAERGKWLALDDPLLIRLGAMMRLFTPAQGEALAQGLARTPHAQTVRHAFASAGNMTYLPAVFVNLINHPALGNTQEERITAALPLALPLLTRILTAAKKRPLNFNQVAAVAKQNPYALATARFILDAQGNIYLLCDS